MKVRKLAVAMALVGGLGSGVANALGLGEVELRSFLNEPLGAEIVLRRTDGINPADIIVNEASRRDYERLGISRDHFLSNLRFDVSTGPDGRLVINVSSRQPVREPFLNFLVEVVWPNGRVMREYSVLLDPPVYAEHLSRAPAVTAPTAAPQISTQREVATPTRQPDRTMPRPTTTARVSQNTFGPTGASDTLWGIALAVRPDESVTPQQVMLALQDLNPDAFIDGNINRMKRGQVLRIPSEDQIRARTRQQALTEVSAQNAALASPAARVVDTAAPRPAERPPVQPEADAELRLVASDTDSVAALRDGASAAGAAGIPGGVEQGQAVLLEELDASRRENEDLQSRVGDLQDQVATLQRLIELKNTQLAEMQQQAIEGRPAVQPIEEALEVDPAETDPAVVDAPDDYDGEAERDEGLEQPLDTAAVAESEAAAEEDEDLVAVAPPAPAVERPERVTPPPAPEKGGFFRELTDAIRTNTLYQIAVGGGLVVLLLILLLLARRNASREKAFYDELNRTSAADADVLDLGQDDAEDAHDLAGEGQADAIAEAEGFIAYGQLEQAAQVLEHAISREPSRGDLRLKLLAVYAEAGNRDAFEKQYSEVAALDEDELTAEADALRSQLDDAEGIPSIDDLESQLRSDNFGAGKPEASDADDDFSSAFDDLQSEEQSAELDQAVEPEKAVSDDFNLSDFELDVADEDVAKAEDLLDESATEESDKGDDYAIEYDTSFLQKGETAEAETAERDELAEDDFADLETLETAEAEESIPESELADLEALTDEVSSDLDDLGELEALDDLAEEKVEELSPDESFLDELDAELEKVAQDEQEDLQLADSALDDLELDVSDEDLALMEEVAEAAPEQGIETLDESDELDAELTEAELADLSELGDGAADAAAGDEVPKVTPATGLDESLGEADEEDFDFLAGTDEAATKLDLARAYVEMGDAEGARDILEEVALEGNEEQKKEAQELLKNLG
ncbi:MAG: hypothetical protein LAT63_11245 [Marinobacter sp.]|nr:hypothetical protein [Marinobacter sp.]